jgi:CheY-like chemotaxis protein
MRTRDGGKKRFPNAIAQACGVIAAGFGFFALLGRVLRLPLLAGLGAVRRNTAEASSPSGAVLVVDDEEMIRQLYVAVLPRLGFRTLVASNGEEAVAIFRDHEEEIACIILDLTMPRLDGVATLDALRRIKPDVKVIFSSGYNEEEATRRFAGRGPDGFIQKPYCLEALMAELERVLGRAYQREHKKVTLCF